MQKLIQTTVSACILAAFAAHADDWPQWLGPQRDAVWRETGILEKFPESGPKIRWRTEIGKGYAGPTVAGDRVYVMDRQTTDGPSRERLLCLDDATGKLVWKQEWECAYSISFPAGPRVAPLVSGGKVYTLGAEGRLQARDLKDGNLVWSHDFKEELHVKAPMWGFAGHPILDGNRLICIAAGPGSTVIAYDKDTGKELWRAIATKEPGYSSPMIYEAGGRKQLIIWQPEAANSLDPATGEVLWTVPFQSNMGLSVASPRKLGNLLFMTSFYNGALMLRLDEAKPAATVIWKTEKAGEQATTHLNAIIPTPFLEDGYIYGICSYGQLRCLKAETGERVWETFKAATGISTRWGNAFLVKHDNRFFIFNEQGDLIIARLSPAGYDEISRAHLIDPINKDPGRLVVWSHPAFAHKCVYVRNDKEILSADLSAN